MGGGAQQRYPRLSGVATSLQRDPLVGGGVGGGGSVWLGGLLGPPFYDHIVGGGGAASIGPTGIDQSYNAIRGKAKFRSTKVAVNDSMHAAINGDTTASHYDFSYWNLGGDGFPDNTNGFATIDADDPSTAGIWTFIFFEIQDYSSAIYHDVIAEVTGGPKGVLNLAALFAVRHHVAAALTDFEVSTDGGLLAEDSRMTCWFI